MKKKKEFVIKINIGCGPIGKDDWINMDYGLLAFIHKYKLTFLLKRIISFLSFFRKDINKRFGKLLNIKWPGNLLVHDCLRGLPFKNNEVDYVFTSHFLEHVKYYQALPFLKEVYRVLKKGGWVRISVPDLSLLIQKYIADDQSYFQKHSDVGWHKEYSLGKGKTILRGDAFSGSFFPSYTRRSRGTILEKLTNVFIRPHWWMYDFESLSDLLRRAGFEKIKRCQYKKGYVPDIDQLDAHPAESLYVEAQK